jgi:hypothetical protein
MAAPFLREPQFSGVFCALRLKTPEFAKKLDHSAPILKLKLGSRVLTAIYQHAVPTEELFTALCLHQNPTGLAQEKKPLLVKGELFQGHTPQLEGDRITYIRRCSGGRSARRGTGLLFLLGAHQGQFGPSNFELLTA